MIGIYERGVQLLPLVWTLMTHIYRLHIRYTAINNLPLRIRSWFDFTIDKFYTAIVFDWKVIVCSAAKRRTVVAKSEGLACGCVQKKQECLRVCAHTIQRIYTGFFLLKTKDIIIMSRTTENSKYFTYYICQLNVCMLHPFVTSELNKLKLKSTTTTATHRINYLQCSPSKPEILNLHVLPVQYQHFVSCFVSVDRPSISWYVHVIAWRNSTWSWTDRYTPCTKCRALARTTWLDYNLIGLVVSKLYQDR